MPYPIQALIAFCIMCAFLAAADCAQAQDVKYCKNYTTGEIITVPARMPCPYPTAKL